MPNAIPESVAYPTIEIDRRLPLISYTLLNGVKAVIPSATESIAYVEMILSVPMAIAELGLAGILIRKGFKKCKE